MGKWNDFVEQIYSCQKAILKTTSLSATKWSYLVKIVGCRVVNDMIVTNEHDNSNPNPSWDCLYHTVLIT